MGERTKERGNRRRRKTETDEAVLMLKDNEFDARAGAPGNARSPMVDRLVAI